MAEYIEYGSLMQNDDFSNDNELREGALLRSISIILLLISFASFLGLLAHLTGLWVHPLLQSFWQSFNMLSFYLPALFFVSSRALIRSNWLHAFGLLSFGILPLITLNGVFQILLGTPSNFNIWLTQRLSQTYSLWLLSAIFAVQVLFLLHPGFRHFLFRLSKLALESFQESERYPEEGLTELENPADLQRSISPESIGTPELPKPPVRGKDPFPTSNVELNIGADGSTNEGLEQSQAVQHAQDALRYREAQEQSSEHFDVYGQTQAQEFEESQEPQAKNPEGNELPELRSFGDINMVDDDGYESLSAALDRPSHLANYDFETLKRQLTDNRSEEPEENEELFEFSESSELSEFPNTSEEAALRESDPGLDVLSTDTNLPEDWGNSEIPKVNPVQAAFDQANLERPSFFEDSKNLAERLDSAELQTPLEPNEQYDEYLQAQRDNQRQERIMMRIQETEGDLVDEEEANKLLQREQSLGDWREAYSEQIALSRDSMTGLDEALYDQNTLEEEQSLEREGFEANGLDAESLDEANKRLQREQALGNSQEAYSEQIALSQDSMTGLDEALYDQNTLEEEQNLEQEGFEADDLDTKSLDEEFFDLDEEFFDLQETLQQSSNSDRTGLDLPSDEEGAGNLTEDLEESSSELQESSSAISLKDWLKNDPTAPMRPMEPTAETAEAEKSPSPEQKATEKEALEPVFSSEDVSWDEFAQLDKEFSGDDLPESILKFDGEENFRETDRQETDFQKVESHERVPTEEKLHGNNQISGGLEEDLESGFDDVLQEDSKAVEAQDWSAERHEADESLEDDFAEDDYVNWEDEQTQTRTEEHAQDSYVENPQNEELREPEFGESVNTPMEAFSVADATEKALREREEREEERAQKMLAPRVMKTWGNYHISVKELIPYDESLELRNTQIDSETEEAGESLLQTLKKFKIEAEMTHILRGPSITEFGILPAPGIKLNRVEQLADNLAMELAARSIRIVAPIPGKKAVGIEIPNRKRSTVSCLALLDSDAMREAQKEMELPIVLGKEINGSVQIADLRRMPHLLIAGATGSGKSVCVNVIISSLILSRTPLELRLMMIDPKIVELKQYNDIPHLLTPVITDASRALQALQWISSEMERRYALLDAIGAGNKGIESYNRHIKEKNLATMPLEYIVVIIDEFADLMSLVGKELESMIARLAAMSRAVGIHLVLATQRPSVDVVTGLIKANFPTRIAFMVASQTDSRTILDMKGAEQLLGQGDMLFSLPGNALTRIQGAYLSEDDVEEITNYTKRLGKPAYLDEIIFEEDEREDTHSLESGGDDLFPQAVEIALQAGEISTSYLQRKLSIGYNRAARIIDEMEERGIIGPAQGSKKREVLAT